MSAGSPSLDQARQLDLLCQRYEAAWRQAAKGGTLPGRAAFLAEAPEALRAHLEPELLALDQFYHQCNTASAASLAVAGVERFVSPVPIGYELLGELGRGGMGIVYQARQIELQRIVALKMLAPHGPLQARAIARFRREAETIAQLHHPAIVQIYEFGEVKGVPWLALEYVPGGSLDRQLNGAPQPARRAAQLVFALAEAVDYAHHQGVVHRDLKPANVLLESMARGPWSIGEDKNPDHGPRTTDYGLPKITDFGLAKCLDEEAATLTGTGDMLGTPSYMAPEQTEGKPDLVGPLADVYGLGAILYELLTGRPPFRAESAMETVYQVRHEEPVSPSRLQPRLPRDLVTICLKCLEKEPRRRYASAAALAEDLRRFLEHEPIRARPVGLVERTGKWARRRPAVAGLILAVVAVLFCGLGATGWQWRHAERRRLEAEDANRAKEAALDRQRIALAQREWLADNATRADELLAECSVEQKQQWEWRYLQRLCNSELATFTEPTAPVRSLAFRPDGRALAAVCADGAILVWNMADQPATCRILRGEARGGIAVAFHPTADCLVAATTAGVQLWQPSTGVFLGRLDQSASTGTAYSLAFAPRDGRLAIGWTDGTLQIWQVEERRVLKSWRPHGAAVAGVAWSPDGQQLASAGYDRTIKLHAAATGKLLRQLPGHQFEALCVAFSPDGQALASGGWDWKVRVHDLARGRERFMLGEYTTPVAAVAFSPDGRRLASASYDGSIKLCDALTGQVLGTLHGHSGATWSLAFSPDGWRLATAGNDQRVKLHDITTSPEAFTLPGTLSLATSMAFRADGRRLAVGHLHDRVRLFDTWTRQSTHLLEHPGGIHELVWNTAGDRLASVSQRQTLRIWQDATGQLLPHPPGLPEAVQAIHLGKGGTFKAVCGHEQMELWSGDETGSRRLHSLPDDRVRGVRFSVDGRRLAIPGPNRLRVYECDPCHCLRELTINTDIVSMALQGDLLAIGLASGTIEIHSLVGTTVPLLLRAHAGPVSGLAFHPDGQRLASTGGDWTLKLWDTRNGHEMLTLRRYLHQRSVLAFSADGRQLAAFGIDLFSRVWSAEEAAELLAPERLQARLRAWEDSEAQAAEADRHWFGAEFHLNRLLAQEESTSLRQRRGRARALLHDWAGAHADYAAVAQALPGDPMALRSSALLELANSKPEDYGLLWQRMLNRFGSSPDRNVLSIVAYTGLVGPPGQVEPDALMALLEKRLGLTGSVDRRLAAGLVRAGRAAQAVRQYELMQRTFGLRAWDWFFLTLAHLQLGKRDRATACWNQAQVWIAQMDHDAKMGRASPNSWVERIEVTALQRQVEAALRRAER